MCAAVSDRVHVTYICVSAVGALVLVRQGACVVCVCQPTGPSTQWYTLSKRTWQADQTPFALCGPWSTREAVPLTWIT